jgi:ABC-type transport system substrate-binding protein/DNA-binding SARP family transcriptional activator/streptogramin lyase
VNGGARLEFGILGPLEVRVDGVPVRIGGPRQRALLAQLLCNANRTVSRERLIDELLSDQPADTAEHTLRVQISRLRKALAVDSDEPRLIARAPGYLLRIEAGELDLDRFDQRVVDGRQALEHGDCERAAVLLRGAEALWRGRPLADLEFEPFAQFEVQRLEELRLIVAEQRIEAELALGRHAELCPELEVLVAEHPLRERLRGQLMLALYRSGRQADALEVYRVGRALLVDELGLEPGPQLRRLERSILEHDSELELSGAERRPTVSTLATLEVERAREEPAVVPALPVRRPRRRRLVALALGVSAAIAAIAAIAVAPEPGGSSPVNRQLHGNVLALLSPGGAAMVPAVKLRARPTDVTAGFGSMWVTEADAGDVVRVGQTRRTVLATIPVGAHPTRIVAAGGQVWVLDPVGHTVSSIDPNTNTVAQTFSVGKKPSDLAFSSGSLWVADRGNGTVVRLNPVTGRVEQVVRTGGDPTGLAVTAGAVWVADDESGTVDRIDPQNAAITKTIRVGDAPAAIASTPGAIWVLDPLDATASRIDLQSDSVVATTALGGAPASLAWTGSSLWVGEQQAGRLLRLDPRTGSVKSAVAVGGPVSALATAGRLWIAIGAAAPVHRGGTLTSVGSGAVIDTVDPAASTSWNVAPPQELGLTNDGLVTLDHVAGRDGARLVPDLALALPVPSDNGLTYTFQLRPGLRYSTGAPVKPSDVTHSFERLFAIRSSGASLFQAITGAAACTGKPSSCDLSRGIVANDHAGTVTFHLTRRDPDFLYKLTIAYADVLPASIPDKQARAPLPATGPYMITTYVPGRELRLVRNPRFREWSAAAQPAGYPNQIIIPLHLDGSQGAAAIAAGTADFMPNLGQIPGSYATYFLRQHRRQVRVNPVMSTSFLFLNVNAPPFNRPTVRRALNLAFDRRAAVSGWGGPIAAKATCQVLPPGLPGYRPYCPYTREHGAGGARQGPDLAEARRLVASSGTEGVKVTVWNSPGLAGATDETKDAVTALRQLGYRASLRLLPDSTYYTYTNNSSNHAQVIDGGWNADYPSADDFFGKLTCSYFVPRDGLDTTDASEYCNPAFDQQVAHAADLQATDPLAADAAWARLDREVTNLALWVPTVTPNEIDLISRRVHNYEYNPLWGTLIDQIWVR